MGTTPKPSLRFGNESVKVFLKRLKPDVTLIKKEAMKTSFFRYINLNLLRKNAFNEQH